MPSSLLYLPPLVPKSSATAVPSHLAATAWEPGALFARISSSSSSLPQRLGLIIREVAAHISHLTTLSDQLANADFGDTAQGCHLLAGSVYRQIIALCHSLQGAQFFRAEGTCLFAIGSRGERSLRHLQKELGHAPASARHAASAHPTGGGLDLPRVPYRRREKLSSLPPRHQRRKLVSGSAGSRASLCASAPRFRPWSLPTSTSHLCYNPYRPSTPKHWKTPK
eukprot:2789718-Pleurochrysis_carterae.AAC.1